MDQKTIMISMPMARYTEVENEARYSAYVKELMSRGYKVLETFVPKAFPEGVINLGVWYLGESVTFMSYCDAVYFAQDWRSSIGCRLEHDIANLYGLECIYELDQLAPLDKRR